ncbi:DUF4097 family beta strand repeat-containing protein [Fodinibius saliphilus]|uniref:DUF4097 family beta strand repeat-containing protein n=1 Tax=Fodinibius saliphilus TaxID=1920650 RepID=UPI001108C34F|nr:DUF4097 family beta strand repeat-containing protein [Fodinibius saliphilus]
MKYPSFIFRPTITIAVLATLLVLNKPFTALGQGERDTIKKEITFSDISDTDNMLKIMNLNGSVTVESYNGKRISFTINEELYGSSKNIKQAKNELKYKFEQRGNVVLAYLDAPFIKVRFEDGEVYYSVNRKNDDYKFVHNVEVKVPQDVHLKTSTINKGDIKIDGHFKTVEARNVNGALKLSHLVSKTKAHTVNGDITLSYDKAPKNNSSFKTVNGTIDITLPEDLSADIYFKSLHGDLYTDFKDVKRLKSHTDIQTNSHGSKGKYYLSKQSPFRIGEGGTELSFNVLNGDVYIRKK